MMNAIFLRIRQIDGFFSLQKDGPNVMVGVKSSSIPKTDPPPPQSAANSTSGSSSAAAARSSSKSLSASKAARSSPSSGQSPGLGAAPPVSPSGARSSSSCQSPGLGAAAPVSLDSPLPARIRRFFQFLCAFLPPPQPPARALPRPREVGGAPEQPSAPAPLRRQHPPLHSR